MSSPASHFIAVNHLTVFQAANSNIRPVTIEENTEYVEIITKGIIYWEENGRTREYGAGTIFWHQCGEQTIYRTPPDNLYQCFCCKFTVAPGEPRLCPRIGLWNGPITMETTLHDWQNLYHSKTLNNQFLTIYISGMLLRQMTVPQSSSLPPTIENACAIINRDLRRNINTEELANICGLSRPQLFRQFKKHLRLAPYQYQQQQRMTRARELLASTDIPIKNVAVQCGFENIEVFYRHFKHTDGITPGEYRQRNHIDNTASQFDI